ncbi:hypothetical protein CASFOL_021837 [Castilleja foliolosa]|uniref:Protein FAR1-RELATED SEQUENCE n=1 Tax=Castilleja foliolosa TaxID=1961234 RepID=A0ABD3CXQ3_9LAMI
MEFESKEDAFKFYKEYALSAGFSTIIKPSRRSRISGKFIDAKFVCTNYGTKRAACPPDNSNPLKKKRGRIIKSVSKTDCKACMHVKSRQDGKWVISSFTIEHNHDLVSDLRNNVHLQARKRKTFVRSHLGFLDGDARDVLDYLSQSMRGRAPNVILTDQDPILKETINEVFSDSRHCFCLWYILSKVQEKLGHVIRKHEDFVNKHVMIVLQICGVNSILEKYILRRWTEDAMIYVSTPAPCGVYLVSRQGPQQMMDFLKI